MNVRFFFKELSEKSFDTNTGPAARGRPGELRATDRKWSYDTKALYCITSQRRSTI